MINYEHLNVKKDSLDLCTTLKEPIEFQFFGTFASCRHYKYEIFEFKRSKFEASF